MRLRMKLHMKMFAMFSLLFTAGFLFLLFFTNRTVGQTSRRMVESFSTQSFSFKAQEVGQWLGQRVTELRMIAGVESLQDGEIEDTIPYIARLNENVGTQYGNEWGTFALGYTDGIGWVSEDLYIDVSERAYFQEAMKGEQEYVLSEPVVSRTDQAAISLICYPLRNEAGEVFGFLNAAISLEKLSEIVAELDFYDGQTWIMDAAGTVYTRTGDLPMEGGHVIAEAAARNVIPEEAVPGEAVLGGVVPGEAALEEVVSGERTLSGAADEDTGGSDSAPEVYRISGPERTVFYTSVPYAKNWYLCTSIQNSLIMRDTRQLMMRLTAVFLAVMALLFLITYGMSRGITRPVHSLVSAMKALEQGDWEAEPETRGQDEIAHMSRAFVKMRSRLRNMMEQIARDEQEKRTAELRVLQAQINPHFLYNTLDTLLYKAYETDDEDMITMIESLSAFFRISLSRGREIIPLEKELEHVKSYLKIQKIRFQDVLSYEIRVDVTDSFSVLKLILQPLAENAIQHGIKPKLAPGYVKIHVWQEEDTLYLEAADDGVGMSAEKLSSLRAELESRIPKESYGLINVSNRLKLLYGDRADLQVESEAGVGTTVRIVLRGLLDSGDRDGNGGVSDDD